MSTGTEAGRRRTVVLVASSLVVVAVTAWALVAVAGGSSRTSDGGEDELGWERVDAAVSPRAALRGDDTVFVSTGAFSPGTVEVMTCLDGPDTRVPNRCSHVDATGFFVPAEGRLEVAVTVPRVATIEDVGDIDATEAVDCAVRRCVLAVVQDGRWAGAELAYADDVPAVDPEPAAVVHTDELPGTLDVEGPIVAGTEVGVAATGFVPGEPVTLGICTPRVFETGPVGTCLPLSDGLYGTAGSDVDLLMAVTADGTGRAATRVAVPERFTPIFSDDEVACTGAPGDCLLVLLADAELRRSSFLPLTVTPA